ncbi:MAG TPA: DNA topoisomerase IB [Mesorhizobium sp.]|jgi:DNA topoisomerase-1|nr:DNA topoisomerase IB [Mesorhizobium sp.]
MLQKNNDPRVPEIAAALASLSYANDSEPGIRRRRVGKGFCYYLPDGSRLCDRQAIKRIASLAIPPAYKDVWISPDPDSHIQATGRDEKGRKQYRYHPRWAEVRDEAKYGNLVAFGHALPAIRTRIDADLRKRGLSKERVLASIVWLLEHTMIRVGNHEYAKQNKSFGLTTLRDRHVQANGDTLRFKFKGKSGKEWDLDLTDRRIVKVVRGAQDLPGQHLFQYLGEDGERHAIRSNDVNAYIKEISECDFTAKTFRTWDATQMAAKLLRETPLPETKKTQAQALNAVIDAIANRLGNTRAVCRKSYIHPRVIEHWGEDKLGEEMWRVRQSFEEPIGGLDEDETLLLKWLEATG